MDTRIQFRTAAAFLTLALCQLPALAADPEVSASDLPRVAPKSPEEALRTFQIRHGFQIELAAAEPEVVDPVALSFDENGRLYVVEMRDYSERRDERMARIRLLEDTDGDGRHERSSIFVDGLPWATAVICYGGGVFVGASPDILYCKDTNSDGVADVKKVVFTGFGETVERLNVQQLLNSFIWGLDNRIHGAGGGNGGRIRRPDVSGYEPVETRGRDFSFDPRTLDFRAEAGGGQYGMAYDNAGRKFVCSNSSHIRTVMHDPADMARNPAFNPPSATIDIAADGPAAEVFRLSPDEPWRVIRTQWRVSGQVPGIIEGGGRPSGYFTGATGIAIYRGDTWPDEFKGDAFTADCGSNLVHRKRVIPDGVSLKAQRPDDEQRTEFLASTDNWFRPVQLANGPDGGLYICDMYREVIEHPWSLPPNLKKHLDLNSGNDRGRIYRVVPENFKRPPLPRLGAATTPELVSALEHPNGWHRDTASRLLFERNDPAAVPLLKRLAAASSAPLARVHALHALRSLNGLTTEVMTAALQDSAPLPRQHAVQLAATLDSSLSPAIWKQFAKLGRDSSILVRYQLAFTLGKFDYPEKANLLAAIAAQNPGSPWITAAVLSSAKGCASDILKTVLSNAPSDATPLLAGLIATAIAFEPVEVLDAPIRLIAGLKNTELKFLLSDAWQSGLGKYRKTAATALVETALAITQDALQTVKDSAAPLSARTAALTLIGRQNYSESKVALLPLLASGAPEPLRLAAVKMAASAGSSEADADLLRQWASLPAALRAEALLRMLPRPASARAILQAIHDGKLRAQELALSQMVFLRQHPDANLRARAAEVLGDPALAERPAALQKYQTSLLLSGRKEQGKEIFASRCASCHRFDGMGTAVGPDLVTVKTAGKETLLANIIDPNREVAPKYHNYVLQTQEGETFSGIMARETESAVTLLDASGQEQAIPRSRIRQLENRGRSIMPEGLEEGLSPQDMADLLAFVIQQAPRDRD